MSFANRDDNLNRATSIGGVNCTNDILGNRLTKSGQYYNWDFVNRLVHTAGNNRSTTYSYRADGMRVAKSVSVVYPQMYLTNWQYRYDGQMNVEEIEQGVDYTNVTRYGLGARGIDFIENVANYGGPSGGTTTVSYPIYDAHGNMVANLAKSGTNDYALSNQRSFDAWGNVRIGLSTGNPTGRYCANIGHKQDDESGLIYMRARYYEPTSGRFASKDRASGGKNGYIYANNASTFLIDYSGNETTSAKLEAGFWSMVASFIFIYWSPEDPAEKCFKLIIESTLLGIDAVKTVLAGLAADMKYGPGYSSAIAISMGCLVAGIMFGTAAHQIHLMILMAEGDEADYTGVHPSEIAGDPRWR